MCRILSVSETGYYKWLRTGPTKRKWEVIMPFIYKIIDQHPNNCNYGVARMKIALEQMGLHVPEYTVKHDMNSANLLNPSYRSPTGLTKFDKKALRPKYLRKRQFTCNLELKKTSSN